jgi:hypothetical protein
VKASDCIAEGWNLAGQNYGLFFGTVFIMIVTIILISFIPILSLILEPIVLGPLSVGLYSVFLRKLDGEAARVGEIFSEFKHFIPAVALSFIISAPFLISDAIQLSIDYGLIFSEINTDENLRIFGEFNVIFALMWFSAFFIFLILQLWLYFSYLLIAEHNLGAIDAIKLSVQAVSANLSGLVALFFLEILLIFAGLLACLVGLLFIMPVIYAADVAAYRRIFPKTNLQNQHEPPPLNFYDGSFGSAKQS